MSRAQTGSPSGSRLQELEPAVHFQLTITCYRITQCISY